MPKISALGALSSRGFGEFGGKSESVYVEDVFSTYLYTGNGSAQTITNGVDLAGKGGLVWTKCRSTTSAHILSNTVAATGNLLQTQLAAQQFINTSAVSGFTSSGFSIGAENNLNTNGETYASWTFRKQPKFFDVVTYTGDGIAGRTISHNLGSVPGMIIVKQTNSTNDWVVYHRQLNNGVNSQDYAIYLNLTSAQGSGRWNGVAPTATEFTVSNTGSVNGSGQTYVAYLFAHNAGGFGLDGTQNVISCGSYVGASGGSSITLGYEPQFVLVKKATANNGGLRNWVIVDTMRGFFAPGNYAAELYPNTSGAEAVANQGIYTNATGFTTDTFDNVGGVGETYIYMAIRRGPMKVPNDATKVFNVLTRNGTSAVASISSGFPVDTIIGRKRTVPAYTGFVDRLRGFSPQISSQQNVAAVVDTTSVTAMGNTTVSVGDDSYNWQPFNVSGYTYAPYMFRRAPGFYDVVYSIGSIDPANHNLQVEPELVFQKCTNQNSTNWLVWSKQILGIKGLIFNTDAAAANYFASTPTATSTQFSTDYARIGGYNEIAYLFATCPGVSKVGSYTGTGATQTISCGFAGGARYVLIKRTDSTGDWWAWDTARGMVSGTDPRWAYNSTNAETNANWVYTTTGGFQIVTSDATVNASGGTYIYLAIA